MVEVATPASVATWSRRGWRALSSDRGHVRPGPRARPLRSSRSAGHPVGDAELALGRGCRDTRGSSSASAPDPPRSGRERQAGSGVLVGQIAMRGAPSGPALRAEGGRWAAEVDQAAGDGRVRAAAPRLRHLREAGGVAVDRACQVEVDARRRAVVLGRLAQQALGRGRAEHADTRACDRGGRRFGETLGEPVLAVEPLHGLAGGEVEHVRAAAPAVETHARAGQGPAEAPAPGQAERLAAEPHEGDHVLRVAVLLGRQPQRGRVHLRRRRGLEADRRLLVAVQVLRQLARRSPAPARSAPRCRAAA